MSTAILHGAAPSPAQHAGAMVPAAVRRGYLAACAVLAPLCVPAGPGQSAALDVLNLAALGCGFVLLFSPGTRVRIPLLAPTFLVLAGSLLALLQAPSIALGALALAQDAYLFAWCVLLVHLVQEDRDLLLIARVWTVTAVVVALVAVGQVAAHDGTLAGLLGSRGFRPSGSLYNPNMLADYLVASLFLATVALSGRGAGWRLVTFGALLAGLLATKSNGGMAALAAGLAVFTVVRAFVRRTRLVALGAAALLLAAVALLGAWLHSEWGVGERVLQAFQSRTFAGRMSHSSESRMHIWSQLQRTYARSPLGIGPGNSGALTLGIADRERPDSFRSKEAHSDYLAYAIERGPLGLAGLAWWTLAGFAAVAAWAGRVRSEETGAASGWRSALTPALAAALAASAMHSAVIEKLHFRHFWLVFGLSLAAGLLGRTGTVAEAVAPAWAPPVRRAAVLGEVRS